MTPVPAFGARVHIRDGQVEVTMSVLIDGVEHYIACPVGDGFYFAQKALDVAVENHRKGGMGVKLASSVLMDEERHGGLLGRDTLSLANEVKKG